MFSALSRSKTIPDLVKTYDSFVLDFCYIVAVRNEGNTECIREIVYYHIAASGWIITGLRVRKLLKMLDFHLPAVKFKEGIVQTSNE